MPNRIWWILGDQCYHWFSFPQDSYVVIWESEYFLKRFRYHNQKLWYWYSSLRVFAENLSNRGLEVDYYRLGTDESHLSLNDWARYLYDSGVRQVDMFELTSDETYLVRSLKEVGIEIIWHPESGFLISSEVKNRYFEGKKNFQFLPFYKAQRKELDILMDGDNPVGGKWTYDTDNRKSLPKDIELPEWNISHSRLEAQIVEVTRGDLEVYHDSTVGELGETLLYPVAPRDFWAWFDRFLEERLPLFGTYEDAIDRESHTVFHAVISMNINNGIIHPREIVDKTLAYYQSHQDEISLNQIEGFLRQIIGWREYIKNIYDVRGVEMKKDNFFGFTRQIPESFWTGETGILPIDTTIHKILKTGYAHHIERLMILGNFMLLCEFDPKEVNDWFQALFVDAYEWVMLPNVMGMSQYADGGRMMTKPYISSSNYVLKMSNYPKDGHWEVIWDALFWRFICIHREVLKDQARMHFMVANWDKKSPKVQQELLHRADEFLAKL